MSGVIVFNPKTRPLRQDCSCSLRRCPCLDVNGRDDSAGDYRRVLGPTWSATSGRETKLRSDIRLMIQLSTQWPKVTTPTTQLCKARPSRDQCAEIFGMQDGNPFLCALLRLVDAVHRQRVDRLCHDATVDLPASYAGPLWHAFHDLGRHYLGICYRC